MSKRGSKKGKAPAEAGTPFSNNAFAGLAGLGDSVPAGPTPKAAPAKTTAIASEPATAKARFPNKLVVRMEKKGRRGKTVTRISGVPRDALEPLCKEMKKALGCGATIEESDLILLGDLVSRAVAWFEKAGAKRIVRGT